MSARSEFSFLHLIWLSWFLVSYTLSGLFSFNAPLVPARHTYLPVNSLLLLLVPLCISPLMFSGARAAKASCDQRLADTALLLATSDVERQQLRATVRVWRYISLL